MMKTFLKVLAALIAVGIPVYAFADYQITQGSGTTIFSFVCQTTKLCYANAIVDSTGTNAAAVKGASTSPGATDPALVVSLSPNSAGFTTPVSNASSGVGTTSTNLPNVGYLYGFNGTTWDQLQVDGSKNLKVTFSSTDPCSGTQTFAAISQAASGTIISGTSAKNTYVCSIIVNGSDAENLSVVEGTGASCGTGTFALLGSTTAANGMNFQAGSGIAIANTNYTQLKAANATGDNVCILQSGSGRVAGKVSYVQQ